ncbi:MAG: hypothetical protein F6K03_04490, partial [Kamptonema sp. SIO4C4]|nr:hypothetical protein [Kamptonema sp. SIO4C4]
REVRLGYALYRDAVSFPSGGALVQALGMNPSSRLYPTIDRVMLDEDSVFLLCSDGLSDNDRVEQYWETEILPILTEGKKVDEAVDRLMAIANEKNGHDNITVALVHASVQTKANSSSKVISFPKEKLATLTDNPLQPTQISSTPTALPKLTKTRSRGPSLFVLSLLIVVLLLGGIGVLSFFLFPGLRYQANRLLGNTTVSSTANNTNSETSESEATPTDSPSESVTLESLAVGDYIQIEEAIALQSNPSDDAAETIPITARSILRVSKKQETTDQQNWIELQKCTPTTTEPAEPTSQPTLPTPPSLENNNPDISTEQGWLQIEDHSNMTITPLSANDVQCE